MLRTAARLVGLASIAAAAAAPPAVAADVFAIVGSTVISTAEYDAAYAVAQRSRFYHRRAPEAEVTALKREVGDQLINHVLLDAEAQRRQVEPDRHRIEAQLADYERRYAGNPQWPRMKEAVLPALQAELERRSRRDRLEAQVRGLPAPSEESLRQFYDEHRDKFTEPEQVRLSVILLNVAPSSPRAAWEQAREEAAAIRARLARGADFAELARLHSADASASRGGDMGYLHRGMLPEPVQEVVDRLEPGRVSEPVTVLEGVALLRVDERKLARLREFADVRERAQQLWLREAGEAAWKSFLEQLRRSAPVQVVDASRYPSLPPAGSAKAN